MNIPANDYHQLQSHLSAHMTWYRRVLIKRINTPSHTAIPLTEPPHFYWQWEVQKWGVVVYELWLFVFPIKFFLQSTKELEPQLLPPEAFQYSHEEESHIICSWGLKMAKGSNGIRYSKLWPWVCFWLIVAPLQQFEIWSTFSNSNEFTIVCLWCTLEKCPQNNIQLKNSQLLYKCTRNRMDSYIFLKHLRV